MRETIAATFAEKVMYDASAAWHASLCYIGDRLGLFKTLAEVGPVTSVEFAAATGLNERYLREWLCAMRAAQYVDFEPIGGTFQLPVEHAAVLLEEQSPYYSGFLQLLGIPATMILPRIIDTFKTGGGIPSADYPAELVDITEREGGVRFGWHLTRCWIPALPAMADKLEAGGSVLDAGCGTGLAALAIAKDFPACRVSGFDLEPSSIERAVQNARQRGLEARVNFQVRDCSQLPENEFDLVVLSLVVHDAPDPAGLLAGVRGSLKPGGCCLLIEAKCGQDSEVDGQLLNKMVYCMSVLYCLPTSIAAGGPGLGTALPNEQAKALAEEAGFTQFRRLDLDDVFLALYELRR